MLGPERPARGYCQRVAAALHVSPAQPSRAEPLDFSPRVVAVPWEVIKVI